MESMVTEKEDSAYTNMYWNQDKYWCNWLENKSDLTRVCWDFNVIQKLC